MEQRQPGFPAEAFTQLSRKENLRQEKKFTKNHNRQMMNKMKNTEIKKASGNSEGSTMPY